MSIFSVVLYIFLFLYFTFYIHNSHIANMNITYVRIYNRLLTKFVYAFFSFFSACVVVFAAVVILSAFLLLTFVTRNLQILQHIHFALSRFRLFCLLLFFNC